MITKIRVAIDCRIGDPKQGIGTAVLALAKAMSESDVQDQEYTYIVGENMQDWLAPYIGGPCRLVGIKRSKSSQLRSYARKLPLLRNLYRSARKRVTGVVNIPQSDGYVEENGFDLVHFPTQAGYLTELPSIYQPWDLQHLHYPEFFKQEEVARREKEYRAFCSQALYICVQAEWTKEDLHKQYGISRERIVVIPWGSVLDAYMPVSSNQLARTVADRALPERFFFYPAVTWPHKNHIVIIRALRLLMERGICPDVYFTGVMTEQKMRLDQAANESGVSQQIHFLGFLSPEDLQCMYRLSTAMVFPSKFEGFGLPILEAFQARTAVLCSTATTLPEIARDGALFFDADSPRELADRMQMIWESSELRRSMIERGASVLSGFSIDRTAEEFRKLYRTATLQNVRR